MANNGNLKPFKKGDARINRKGRPKTFEAVRELTQGIAHEIAQSGGVDAVIGGHKVTVVEAIFRQWAQSKNPKLQQAFIEYAFGKVPTQNEHTGKDGGPLQAETKINHAIDGDTAQSIFDILASIGALPAQSDDAKDVGVHTAQPDA